MSIAYLPNAKPTTPANAHRNRHGDRSRRVTLTRDGCSATVSDHPSHGLVIEVRRGATVTDRWHVTPMLEHTTALPALLEEHAQRAAAKDWAPLAG